MPRPPMSDEEKKRAEEFRNTPEGLRKTLNRLKEKESKLLADLAMRDFPELEEPLVEISFHIDEVLSAKENYEDSHEEAAEKESAKLRKRILEYKDKINGLEQDLNETTADRFETVNKEALINALSDLGAVLNKHKQVFKERGVEPTTLLPQLQEIEKIEL